MKVNYLEMRHIGLSEACFDEGVRQNSSSRGRVTPKGYIPLSAWPKGYLLSRNCISPNKKIAENLRMCNFCCTFAPDFFYGNDDETYF